MTRASEHIGQAAAEAASNGAAKATYAGGTLSAVGGLALSNELIALAGLTLAVLGWVTQIVFSLRRDRREAEEHEIRMQHLREQKP